MSTLGKFYGIGVGPGESGLITVAGLKALQSCDVIFAPRATTTESSVALTCLRDFEIPQDRVREISFKMSSNRDLLRAHYRELAAQIASELRASKNAAYLTIGDTSTYSTYGYALAALIDMLPGLEHRTIPGVTSYAAVAAATDWPLGEGKERVLILPCPDGMDSLRQEIETHDIVVLMKIGERLPAVLELILSLGIAEQCSFASHVGMPDQKIFPKANQLNAGGASGYLSTMLIRRQPREKRHL